MEMISFPAGNTYDLVAETQIHAHPVKRGYPQTATQFINLRTKGGYIHAIYEVLDTFEAQPNNVDRFMKRFRKDVQERIRQYIRTRRATFGFSAEGQYDYRFYILSLHIPFNPPYQQIPNYASFTYMNMEEMISNIHASPSLSSDKEENHPGAWLISANGKMYDHASSFATNGFIDWRQRANYNVGDIVFIYCTKPLMRIMYKCEVVKHSMPFSECIDDAAFWYDKNEYEKSKGGQYTRLKLLEQVDTQKLSLEVLHSHGLVGNPQGPRSISRSLYSYIDSHFNDFYTEGLFTDVNESEEYHEGHIRTVKVDVYERSSIARSKCIEHHGCACKICGLDFGKKYGSIGEGFIHVHHLKPLYTIGEDYVVDYKKDLIPVCPNCHAMIHRLPGGESMSAEELYSTLNNLSSPSFLSVFPATITDKPKVDDKMKQHTTDVKETNKYIGRKVLHASAKYGTGIIIAEDGEIIKIKFDNGTKTTFIKDAFSRGTLKFIEE